MTHKQRLHVLGNIASHSVQGSKRQELALQGLAYLTGGYACPSETSQDEAIEWVRSELERRTGKEEL